MIGERIQKAREKMGINQSELARRTGLTPSAVWQIEREERVPSSETLNKLCEALEISSDWVLGIIDEPKLDPQLLAMFRNLGKLSERDQQMIMNMYRHLADDNKTT